MRTSMVFVRATLSVLQLCCYYIRRDLFIAKRKLILVSSLKKKNK